MSKNGNGSKITVNKTSGKYTIVSNFHLRDINLSLKAKGLLTLMLSLSDDWDYSVAGLAAISKEGVDAIRSTLLELEAFGYVIRKRVRNELGQLQGTEYLIYEQPQKITADDDNFAQVEQEGKAENADNTAEQDIEDNTTAEMSLPQKKYTAAAPAETPVSASEYEQYTELIKENISYEDLKQLNPYEADNIDEIVSLMADVVSFNKKALKINGNDYPAEVIKSQFLKVGQHEIEYVLECLKKHSSKINNIRAYLISCIYNAKNTISNYYSNEVRYNFGGD